MDSAILCGGDNLSIIKPIAQLLGCILDILFKGLNAIGIGNIAIAIIIFTLLVKMLMLPLQIKQQKMTKLQSVMNPEIKAIQEKYKGKNSDTVAMQKMQAETKAVYEKYGVSQWGSCVQLLIQMPILFALYRVFQQIPLYISQIKVLFLNILGLNGADGITSVSGYADTLNEIYGRTVDWSNTSTAVTTLNSFTSDQWIKLKEAFPAFSDMITQNLDKINHMNTFLGVNMSQNPGFGLHIAILIPILAGVTQFISVKVSQAGMEQPDSDNPAAASMKMMTYFMPLMSAFLAISLPSGLGVYWIAIRNIKLEGRADDVRVVIPGKTLQEISKILNADAESLVNIYFTNNHVLFEFDQTHVVSRLIEGDYFKISQMLSNDYETKVSINKKEFLDSIDRANLLIREGDKKPIIINILNGLLQVNVNSAIGALNEDIDIDKEGKDIMIGFNPKFLMDALRVIDDENVTMYLVNHKSPCFIRDKEENYIYLILPVNFTA